MRWPSGCPLHLACEGACECRTLRCEKHYVRLLTRARERRFPPLARRLGTLATLKLGLWIAAPAAAALAAPSLLPSAPQAGAPRAALAALLSVKSAASTLAFTASMILVRGARRPSTRPPPAACFSMLGRPGRRAQAPAEGW